MKQLESYKEYISIPLTAEVKHAIDTGKINNISTKELSRKIAQYQAIMDAYPSYLSYNSVDDTLIVTSIVLNKEYEQLCNDIDTFNELIHLHKLYRLIGVTHEKV
ncbi:hypothetical protein ACFBZI_10670 [Moraxella sp. ZJ142]|uniref:hypothetical protein n=1 Tax=Moraxella marmotae TaxID=3344520 RepID=UPI0035D41F4D